MAAIITEKFRQSSADSFKTSFGTDKYYLFVGKSQPWTSEGAASDSLPPAPLLQMHFVYIKYCTTVTLFKLVQ